MELRELFGLRPVSFVMKKDRLGLFGHVESKDGADWLMEVDRELCRDDIERGCDKSWPIPRGCGGWNKNAKGNGGQLACCENGTCLCLYTSSV